MDVPHLPDANEPAQITRSQQHWSVVLNRKLPIIEPVEPVGISEPGDDPGDDTREDPTLPPAGPSGPLPAPAPPPPREPPEPPPPRPALWVD